MTSNCLIRSPCSASDLHSSVHPRVYALGNQARTMACLPRKSDSLYVFPFDACSEKSGAASPIFRSPAAEGAADHAKPTRPIAAIVRALIAPPDERPPVAAVLSLTEHSASSASFKSE